MSLPTTIQSQQYVITWNRGDTKLGATLNSLQSFESFKDTSLQASLRDREKSHESTSRTCVASN
jgi:hypothetical protein